MEKSIKKIQNLLSKRSKKQKELEKVNSEIAELQESRQRRYEQLAYEENDNPQDRELVAIKRRLPNLRERQEDLRDAITAFDRAVTNQAENVQAELGKSLQQKYDDAQSVYNKNNQQHLKMLKEANQFGREKVTPSHQRKDRLYGILSNFRSKRSQWTPEKLIEGVQNPQLFLENIPIGELLGFKETLDKLKAKKTEDERLARAQVLKNREQNVEEREKRALAKMILAGRKSMPEHIKPFITDDASVDLITKLLMTVEPKQDENEKVEKEAVSI